MQTNRAVLPIWLPNMVLVAVCASLYFVACNSTASATPGSITQSSPDLTATPANEDRIRAVSVTRDGELLAVARVGGLSVYQTDTLERLWSNETPVAMLDTSISSDGTKVAATLFSATITIWDIRTGEQLGTYVRPSGDAAEVAWSPVNDDLAILGVCDVIIIAPDTFQILQHFVLGECPKDETLAGQITSMAWAPDGRSMAVGGFEPIRIFDVASGEETQVLFPTSAPLVDMTWASNNYVASIGASRNQIMVWNVGNGTVVNTFVVRDADQGDHPFSLDLSADGELVAVGTSQGLIEIWKSTSEYPEFILKASDDNITSVAFTQDSLLLIAGSANGLVSIWDTRTGEQVKTLGLGD